MTWRIWSVDCRKLQRFLIPQGSRFLDFSPKSEKARFLCPEADDPTDSTGKRFDSFVVLYSRETFEIPGDFIILGFVGNCLAIAARE